MLGVLRCVSAGGVVGPEFHLFEKVLNPNNFPMNIVDSCVTGSGCSSVGNVHLYLVLDSWAVLSCSSCCRGSQLSTVLEILFWLCSRNVHCTTPTLDYKRREFTHTS
jgi:DNA-directed RNA polymerase subunit N (RpoN/RPB10)